MNAESHPAGNGRGALYLVLAVLVAAAAWWIPARWRSLHPAVVRAAGLGTPSVSELALVVVEQQRIGLAERLRDAAAELASPRTNEINAALATLAANRALSPEARILGGPDPDISALVPALSGLVPGTSPSAADIVLQEPVRRRLRAGLAESRSPGAQSVLRTLDLPWDQFAPAGQPGGQPLEAMVVLTGILYERERLSASLAAEIRELSGAAPGSPAARQSLEEFYLDLLSLSRRLDWTSLAELTRKVPSTGDFHRFSAALRNSPDHLALVYTAALMSGDPGGIARRAEVADGGGLPILASALRGGAGSIRLVAVDSRPVLPGPAAPESLAVAVVRHPLAWTLARSGGLLCAAILAALGLRALSRVAVSSAESGARSHLLPGLATVILIGGFLILAGEPFSKRPRPPGKPRLVLDASTLTKPAPAANSSQPRKNPMEPSTIATLFVFGALQLTVYVICLRKIGEILRLPQPAAVRLRLLENEENLFDTGLYVGIGGTATALVMQVLQWVEANLLAAYASNLMGIICVAAVKIGHVRNARRRLILESTATAGPAKAARSRTSGAAAEVNPFTTR